MADVTSGTGIGRRDTAFQRPVTRLLFRALNRFALPAVKAGLGSPLPIGGGLVVLETTGRKSGQPRQVPLVALRLGDRVTVSTVRSSSQWAKNLQADPSASLWLAGRERQATGTVETTAGEVWPLTIASLDLN